MDLDHGREARGRGRTKTHPRALRRRAGAPDAANTRRILLDVMDRRRTSPVDVLVIARDLDGDSRRRRGMEQAASDKAWPFRVVLAWSEPEAEAWYVAGFIPVDPSEAARLEVLIRDLGFDPTRAPHRLLSTAKASNKDAKRVLASLCARDGERERECLRVALAELVERGRDAGLAAFVDALRVEVLPLFDRPPI